MQRDTPGGLTCDPSVIGRGDEHLGVTITIKIGHTGQPHPKVFTGLDAVELLLKDQRCGVLWCCGRRAPAADEPDE